MPYTGKCYVNGQYGTIGGAITKGSYQDHESKTTGREQQVDPFLNVDGPNVVTRADNTAFVESSIELDDDFARTVIVNNLEFTNVAWQECRPTVSNQIVG